MGSVSVLHHHLAIHILTSPTVKKEKQERKWYGTLPVPSPTEATATNPNATLSNRSSPS
jgi:hypothetical protein